MKRGQVTLFIILGIVILAIIILLLFFRELIFQTGIETGKYKVVVPQQFQPVKQFLEDCTKEVTQAGIDFVFLQGGYYKPKRYITLDSFNIAYWYDGKDISPSISTIENEISKFINENFKFCVLRFGEPGYMLSPATTSSKIKLEKNKFSVEINYPTTVNYKEINFKMPPVALEIPSDAYGTYNAAKELLKLQNKTSIDITGMTTLGYDVSIFSYDRDIVYYIRGNETSIMFANEI